MNRQALRGARRSGRSGRWTSAYRLPRPRRGRRRATKGSSSGRSQEIPHPVPLLACAPVAPRPYTTTHGAELAGMAPKRQPSRDCQAFRSRKRHYHNESKPNDITSRTSRRALREGAPAAPGPSFKWVRHGSGKDARAATNPTRTARRVGSCGTSASVEVHLRRVL
jgi:hypothetical protein